jgi:AcrR family transcriptional regulator
MKLNDRSLTPGARRPNREADVLEAAVEVFWKKTFVAASTQDVADRVGMLKGSLYHYIDAKEDLLWSIVDDVHRGSTEILAAVESLDEPALDRIRIYIERHVEWYLRNVEKVSVYFRDWRHLTGARHDEARRRRQGYAREIRRLIAAAQAEGDIGEHVDPKYATTYLLAAVNAVPHWYRSAGPDTPDVIARQYAALTVALLAGSPR